MRLIALKGMRSVNGLHFAPDGRRLLAVLLAPKSGGGSPTGEPTKTAAAEPKTWYVTTTASKSPNAATTKKTLADFNRDLKNGDSVVLLDDTAEVTFFNLSLSKDIRVSSADPAKPTRLVYKPPAKAPAKPSPAVILLDGTENVTLSGVILDAGGYDVGVQVSGGARGTKLENVTVKGAKKTAVLLKSVTAEAANPLTVTGCRFVLSAGGESAVGVTSTKELETRGVKIDGCRFEGPGSGAGVRFDGPASEVEVKNGRVWNFDNGVWFAPVPEPVAKLSVTLDHVTFFATKAGVRVDTAAERTVAVRWCYFAGGGEAAVVPDPKGVSFGVNGRDAGTQPGASKAEEAQGTLTVPVADAADDKFLKGKVTVGGKGVGAE